jgi:gluconate 2-dehydrogenase gamma chain
MNVTRRTALEIIGSAPVAAAMAWTAADVEAASGQAQAARRQASSRGAAFQPKFFTPHEYATVVLLADLIIPKDERSGSASDAGVPEFMDFMMIDQPVRQTAMRGGLALIDHLCESRFDKRFVDCSDDERRKILDSIAYPPKSAGDRATADGSATTDARAIAGSRSAKASAERDPLAHAIAFFSSFRDLTASGFWSTKMGIEDLQYLGNRYVADWKGCPPEALEKLGVKYEAD